MHFIESLMELQLMSSLNYNIRSMRNMLIEWVLHWTLHNQLFRYTLPFQWIFRLSELRLQPISKHSLSLPPIPGRILSELIIVVILILCLLGHIFRDNHMSINPDLWLFFLTFLCLLRKDSEPTILCQLFVPLLNLWLIAINHMIHEVKSSDDLSRDFLHRILILPTVRINRVFIITLPPRVEGEEVIVIFLFYVRDRFRSCPRTVTSHHRLHLLLNRLQRPDQMATEDRDLLIIIMEIHLDHRIHDEIMMNNLEGIRNYLFRVDNSIHLLRLRLLLWVLAHLNQQLHHLIRIWDECQN